MTAGELIRSARLRAGLTQAELGRRLSMPRSQIARWEPEEVEPALDTVRKVLRACGFDLSMALVPYGTDEDREVRLRELHRLTPQERLRRMLDRDARA
jgi:transcriptional regulator with XRE-family HTH domain